MTAPYSIDHDAAPAVLAETPRLLIIQDLDGVCMPLVRDPLTRSIERRYIDAARMLDGELYMLTNGEHIGRRGVNGLVDRVVENAATHGLYLPGLGAGGVQLQDRYGAVTHPGVGDAELAFLAAVPQRAAAALSSWLAASPFALAADEIAALVEAAVLDNPASPTLNLNGLHHRFAGRIDLYARLQQAAARFLREQLAEAAAQGLGDAFFVHYAPNLGRDERGDERMKPADAEHPGTTDYQLMLRGAIKEVGVLVLLNHYYARRTGEYPLGADFNARQAPQDLDALVGLAADHFDPAVMPRIVADVDGRRQRGGSDRGFLTLVQRLGERFGIANLVCYVDSSGGEVRRAGIDTHLLAQVTGREDPCLWQALQGISDAEDPLRLDLIFTGGHTQYVDFFCQLAAHRRVKTVTTSQP
jgi:glucosylglycerol 3-phosphatase